MEIKGIKYTSPVFDGSGYAEASRQYIKALHSLGIPITVEPVSFEPIRPDLGETGELINNLVNRQIDYNIKIMHLTPEHYEKKREDGVFNIGYSIWETSRLHPSWPDHINNNVDLALVGCEWNIDVYKDSGVTVPIYKVPHGIDISEFDDVDEMSIGGVGKNDFIFYSIFQWTERKHPLALIKAYWSEFRGNEDVVLVLKTYRSDYSEREKNAIRDTIKRVKDIMPLDDYPRILLITEILSRDELLALHKKGDCFVLFQRSEGFGLPHFEAAACANPVITTGMGGNCEFTKPDNSYLLDYTWTPVFGMPWCPWYRGDQWWAEPDVKHGTELMRHVFENREEAKDKGKLIQKYVAENFDWETIARRILEVIEGV